jgi:hypothetical protein
MKTRLINHFCPTVALFVNQLLPVRKAALKTHALQTLARDSKVQGGREAFGVRASSAPLCSREFEKSRIKPVNLAGEAGDVIPCAPFYWQPRGAHGVTRPANRLNSPVWPFKLCPLTIKIQNRAHPFCRRSKGVRQFK